MNASVRMKDLESASALRVAGSDRKEGAATIEEMASIPFEAWKAGEGWTPPASGAEWQIKLTESVATLQLAWAALHRTKPELIAMHDKLDPQINRQFIENIQAWHGYYEGSPLFSTPQSSG